MKEMFDVDNGKMSLSDLVMAMTSEDIENTAKANGAMVGTREVCVTTGGPDPGANCVFPFTYNGVEYNGCTSVDSVNSVPWCSTSAIYNGQDGENGFGHCATSCRMHGNLYI